MFPLDSSAISSSYNKQPPLLLWKAANLGAPRTRVCRLEVGLVAALKDMLPARLALALTRAELVRQQELALVELVQQKHLNALCALPLRISSAPPYSAIMLLRQSHTLMQRLRRLYQKT